MGSENLALLKALKANSQLEEIGKKTIKNFTYSVNNDLIPNEKIVSNEGKLIESGQSLTGWTANTSTTVTLDSSNVLIGTKSLKFTVLADGFRSMTKDITPITFDGRTRFSIDVFKSTLTNNEVRIYLGNTGLTKHFTKSFTGLVDGWNHLEANISDFSAVGGMTISDDIAAIRYNIGAAVTGDTISFSNARLIKANYPQIVFTFDDLYPSHYSKVFPLFKQKNAIATLCLQGNRLGQALTINQIKEMVQYGFEVANHSYSHQPFVGLPITDLYNEVNLTNEIIQSNFVNPSSLIIAYPNGSHDDSVIAELKKMGYIGARISDGQLQAIPIPDIKKFKISSSGFSATYNTNKAQIDDLLKGGTALIYYVHDVDDVLLGVISDVMDYCVENNVKFSTLSELLITS